MPRRKRCSSTRTPNIKIDVDPDHLVTGLEELLRQDRSDITTMSGNQDFHHLTPTFSTVPCPCTKVHRAAPSPCNASWLELAQRIAQNKLSPGADPGGEISAGSRFRSRGAALRGRLNHQASR